MASTVNSPLGVGVRQSHNAWQALHSSSLALSMFIILQSFTVCGRQEVQIELVKRSASL